VAVAEGNNSNSRVVKVPEEEAQLEAFKSALLLALSRLPDLTRSVIADQIEEQARRLRVLRGGDQDRLAVQLESFAHTTRLPPPFLEVEVVKRRFTRRPGE
jgi:hypothetical protein